MRRGGYGYAESTFDTPGFERYLRAGSSATTTFTRYRSNTTIPACNAKKLSDKAAIRTVPGCVPCS